MKTVVAGLILFLAFLVCYEKELFALSYGLFGLSLALGVVAIYRGNKKMTVPGGGAAQDPAPGKRAG